MMFNQTTYNILIALSAGEFCSGEWLGEQNKISRAAIGKHIQALQKLGLDIFSVTGKGYRLSQPIELLNSDKIKTFSQLDNVDVRVKTVVNSTNDVIKQALITKTVDLNSSGSTIFSEAQTAGRGRRGKQWFSPLGASLYFSTHWRFEQGISATMGLSLVVGIAIVEALSELGVSDLGLKWPNDIYYQGRKLAGILVELEGQGSDSCDIIIGAGINVQLPPAATKDIDQPFSDISETGLTLSRNQIAGTILRHLIALLNEFEQTGFMGFVDRWHQYDCFLGHQVQLHMGRRCIEGIANGVDAQGGLILKSDNQTQSYFGGEISLRKLTS
jgi:BirA family biotin operon repressor/biotin-[acetyl-CoA-carboxylase] ligase